MSVTVLEMDDIRLPTRRFIVNGCETPKDAIDKLIESGVPGPGVEFPEDEPRFIVVGFSVSAIPDAHGVYECNVSYEPLWEPNL